MSNRRYTFKPYCISLLPMVLKSSVPVAHAGSDPSLNIDLKIKWDNMYKIVLKAQNVIKNCSTQKFLLSTWYLNKTDKIVKF